MKVLDILLSKRASYMCKRAADGYVSGPGYGPTYTPLSGPLNTGFNGPVNTGLNGPLRVSRQSPTYSDSPFPIMSDFEYKATGEEAAKYYKDVVEESPWFARPFTMLPWMGMQSNRAPYKIQQLRNSMGDAGYNKQRDALIADISTVHPKLGEFTRQLHDIYDPSAMRKASPEVQRRASDFRRSISNLMQFRFK